MAIAPTQTRPVTADTYTALVKPVSSTPTELFEHQRTRLADARLAPIKMFDKLAERLPSGLFLLVPPQPAPIQKLDWADLMARVELRGKKGRTYVSGSDMTDAIEITKRPTILKDVEDGRGRLNTHLLISTESITKEGRHSYTGWRGYIHLLQFPWVIDDHGMDILASRYFSSFWLVFYLHDELPTLVVRDGFANPNGGAPSCGEVEEL